MHRFGGAALAGDRTTIVPSVFSETDFHGHVRLGQGCRRRSHGSFSRAIYRTDLLSQWSLLRTTSTILRIGTAVRRFLTNVSLVRGLRNERGSFASCSLDISDDRVQRCSRAPGHDNVKPFPSKAFAKLSAELPIWTDADNHRLGFCHYVASREQGRPSALTRNCGGRSGRPRQRRAAGFRRQPAGFVKPPGTERLLESLPRSACAACSTADPICGEVRVTHLAVSRVIS